jgi:hypothetical protein
MNFIKILGLTIPKKDSSEEERNIWALEASKILETEGLESYYINYPILLTLINDGYMNRNINKIIYTKNYTMELKREYK